MTPIIASSRTSQYICLFFYNDRVKYLNMVSQRIYPTISHSDWLRLYGVLATPSAIYIQLVKVFVLLNIFVYFVLQLNG